VLLDATLKGRGGLDLLRDIRTRHASQRVLMLSTNDESIYAERSLKAGASGYIMKGEAAETLIFAIRSVLNGEVYLSRGLQRKLVKRLLSNESTPVVDPFAQLSDRELEVFSLIGQGKTTRQIAQDLYLSKKTIEAHRAHLKKKLGAKTTAELVRRAVQFNRNHT
jgi:DNA-binding NarL/FixJ family response regulator